VSVSATHLLAGELRRALLAEFGARAIYRRLASAVRDEELARLLRELWVEQHEQVRAASSLFELCRQQPPRDSLRRRALAHVLASLRPVLGQRVILRICADAERTRSGDYARLSELFARTGALAHAQTARDCCTRSARHADALDAWVALGR